MRHGPGFGPRRIHHHRHLRPMMRRPMLRPYRPFWRPMRFGPFFGGPLLLWWLFIPFMMMGCMLLARLLMFTG